MLLQTSANKVESRYMVGGNGILSGLEGMMGCMAKLDDEGWLFVGMVVVGILVSIMSSEAKVEKEFVTSISISVASGSLTSSIHEVDSIFSGMIWILVKAICDSVCCCWRLSETTSSEATSEAF